MRHSNISLTMNTYTDPALLDIAGAVERLPDLPLDATDRDAGQTTGTDGKAASPLAPVLAPTADKLSKFEGKIDHNPETDVELHKREKPANSQGKRGFSGVSTEWAMTDLNRRHPPCKGGALAN